MKQTILGAVLGALVGTLVFPCTVLARRASPPVKLKGFKLHWSLRKTLRFAKRQGWRLAKDKLRSCGVRVVTLVKHGRSIKDASVVMAAFRRRKLYQVSFFYKLSKAPIHNKYQWIKKLRRWARKYGASRNDVVPIGRRGYVAWKRYIGKGRWFSIMVNISRTRPVTIREVSLNLKWLRAERMIKRCDKRRKRRIRKGNFLQ